MQHQLSRSSMWAIESNSLSNSVNTPKRKKRRNWPQDFLELQLLICDKKSRQFDAEIVDSSKTSVQKISPFYRDLRDYLAFNKKLKSGETAPEKFDAKTLTPNRRRSFSKAMQELLTLREVERELKISRTTVWRLRKMGLIKTSALGGIVRIRRRDLERFVSHELMAGRSR